MVIKRAEASDIAGYFGQFDLHNHSFSHCVFQTPTDQSERVHWEKSLPPLDEKIDFIAQRLRSSMQVAARKNVRVLAFTEHPQYTFYSVPYFRYKYVFERVRRQFAPFIEHILWGLELDLEMAKDRKAFVNEDVVGNAAVGTGEKTVGDARVVIGSLHLYDHWRRDYLPKHQRDSIAEYETVLDFVKNREDYFELTMNALSALGAYKKRLASQGDAKSAFVYGHPWGAAWFINKREFEQNHNNGEKLRMNDSHPLYQQFLQYCENESAPIAFFTKDQLADIADAHIAHGLYPEINARYIIRGASEYAFQKPQETLAEVYAQRCAAKRSPAIVSVGSDAHQSSEVQQLNWQKLLQKVPALYRTQVWAENIS